LISCLLLLSLVRYSISQDVSPPDSSLQIEASVEEARVLLKQLNELEFRRQEVLNLVQQLTETKAKQAELLGEIRTQLALEKQAHDYTRKDLAMAEERAAFYKAAYEDLKTPMSKGLSTKWKVILIGGVIVAGAVIGYAVSR